MTWRQLQRSTNIQYPTLPAPWWAAGDPTDDEEPPPSQGTAPQGEGLDGGGSKT